MLTTKDIFGNEKPVQIEIGEWWFNGRIIQQQNHPLLSRFVSFNDGPNSFLVQPHGSFDAAIGYCLRNPCKTPERFPKDYIGVSLK